MFFSFNQRERDAMLLASKLGEVYGGSARGGRLSSPLAGRGLSVGPLLAWLVLGWLSCTTVGEALRHPTCGALAVWLAQCVMTHCTWLAGPHLRMQLDWLFHTMHAWLRTARIPTDSQPHHSHPTHPTVS